MERQEEETVTAVTTVVVGLDQSRAQSQPHSLQSSQSTSPSPPTEQQQTCTKPKQWVQTPLPTDIICGRGARMSHPGNQRFRDLVLAHRASYQKAKRREDKTRITAEIVNRLMGGTTAPARYV